MTTPQDDSSDTVKPKYLTKKVVLNGQTVTLYSLNGATWLSSPDQLPDVMARLDNTRILLADPKAAAEQGIVAPATPKTTGARYRMKGPKPRPILQPDGTLLPPTERLPAPATETEVKLSGSSVEVLDDSPAARIRQLRAPKEEARKNAVKAEKLAAKEQSKKEKQAAPALKKTVMEKRVASKSVGKKPAPKVKPVTAKPSAKSASKVTSNKGKSSKPAPKAATKKPSKPSKRR